MTSSSYVTIDTCRLCHDHNLSRILKLSPTPAGNNFLSKQEAMEEEPMFPLELNYCNGCAHIQLGHSVDPDFLFHKNYHFVSGTSEVNVKHFNDYAQSLIEKYQLRPRSKIVDIGSNDGTCLAAFQNNGMEVLGIDPAENIAKIANRNGIKTINSFFNPGAVSKIIDSIGQPDVITAHNVFAHIRDLSGAFKLVKSLLNPHNIFVFEVGYFKAVFDNLWFDTIYHEHLDYHTLTPIASFLDKNGMKIIDFEENDMQGGSIRCHVQVSNGIYEQSDKVQEAIESERKSGITNLDHLLTFQSRIDSTKKELLDYLIALRKKGKRVVGYGAPTKSTTLLTYFDIDAWHIQYIVDDNPLKQNKLTPKQHIPIYGSEKLIADDSPDYILILAWNFADSIIEKVKSLKSFSGKFIVPLPVLDIR